MNANIFQQVKASLEPRLPDVLSELLPGGRVHGHEYVCASLEGGVGSSSSTNTTTGKGSDFATEEAWGDIISPCRQGVEREAIRGGKEVGGAIWRS